MPKEESTSVFELLAKPVRKALAEAGFTEPTLPQTIAFSSILAGKSGVDCSGCYIAFGFG
jgi:Lhr-like helicase